MQDERIAAPNNTAVRLALWRGLHAQVDAPPHVLEDEIGGAAPKSAHCSVSSDDTLLSLCDQQRRSPGPAIDSFSGSHVCKNPSGQWIQDAFDSEFSSSMRQAASCGVMACSFACSRSPRRYS